MSTATTEKQEPNDRMVAEKCKFDRSKSVRFLQPVDIQFVLRLYKNEQNKEDI